jgi:serine/threonine-protein kinase
MMLTPAGVVKLMDFGIAKAATDRRLTMTGTTMGSLYYMSPEQIQGASDLDARADLYSVGVSLYELVTGKRPFDGDSQFAIMSAHLEKLPVPPITLDPSMPPPLSDAILLAVAKDPNARFQTAAAFRAALGNVAGMLRPAAAAAAPAAARPVAQAQAAAPAVAAKKGGRGLWIGIGALATAMAVIGLIQFGPWKGTSAAPQLPATSTPAPVMQQQAAPVQQQTPVPQQQTPVQQQQAPVQQPAHTQQPSAPLRQPAGQPGQPARQVPAPVQQQQQQAPPPVQQQAPPVQPQQQQAPPSRPAIDPAKQAELIKIREDLAMLQTRANTARSSVQRIERQQAASGLGLRGDIQTAVSMMGTYLEGAVAALNAGDPASAHGFMDKAEHQIETVEKFLGR